MRHPFTYWVIIFLLLPFGQVIGQTVKAFKEAGEQAMKQKDYYAALVHWGNALKQQPDDLEMIFKYAEAARLFYAFDIAHKNYEKVIKKDRKKTYPQAIFQLGVVLRAQGEYEKASEQFQQYLTENPTGEWADQAKSCMSQCEWAIEQLKEKPVYKIQALGRTVNSEYSDFAPLPVGDTLYYSSYRYDFKADKQRPQRKLTKVLYSLKNGRGRPLPNPFNSDAQHTAHVAFSQDEKRLYFTICEFSGTTDIRCSIYYRERDKRKKWKAQAVKLPDSVNMPGFTATQPSIGYDSTAQSEALFFVSDRPGGNGGLDIWKCLIGSKDNEFSAPENLSTINTSGNEVCPHFHTPSQVLYFSSDALGGFGGYDIYVAGQHESAWSTPVALPSPLNSSYNDLYFVPREDLKTGYLASNRVGAQYLDPLAKSCCNDLFSFSLIPPPPPKDSQITSNPTPVPVPVPIITEPTPGIPSRLEDFLPLALYFDNDEPDKRTKRSTTKKAYLDTFDKYYARKGEYIESYANPLSEADKAEAETRMDAFFEDDIRKGQEWLIRFSEILLEKLTEGDTIEIFIKGFTSPRAQSDYNFALGQRRISSLRNHFANFQGGILEPFIKTKQLKITERSFGEATAAKDVSDDLFDLRNSVFSIGAARERRVEIIEIKSD